MIEWPTGLGHMRDIRLTPVDQRIVFNPELGPQMVRPFENVYPEQITGSLTHTTQQLQEFLYFFRVTLAGGSEPFRMEHPLNDDPDDFYIIAFTAPEMVRRGPAEDRVWVYSLTVETAGVGPQAQNIIAQASEVQGQIVVVSTIPTTLQATVADLEADVVVPTVL